MTEYSYDHEESGVMTAAELRRRALFFSNKLAADGVSLQPVSSAKKSIAATFWGQAWNKNIGKYSLFADQLGPGRSYLRHGSIIDLQVSKGLIQAMAAGSSLYDVEIKAAPLSSVQWTGLIEACSGNIAAISDLLAGVLSDQVIAAIVDEHYGLFPDLDQISFSCTCPDWTDVCKHVAAVLYGFSVRLDHSPALLFELRGVDPVDLVTATSQSMMTQIDSVAGALDSGGSMEQLESMFGIDILR